MKFIKFLLFILLIIFSLLYILPSHYFQELFSAQKTVYVKSEGAIKHIKEPILKFKILYPLTKNLIPQAVAVYKKTMDYYTQGRKEKKWQRKFTEEEFAEYIVPKLQTMGIVTGVTVELCPKGVNGTVDIKVGSIGTKIRGSGRLFVEGGKLKLDLYSVKVWILPVPPFLLREVEYFFDEMIKKQDYPIKITDIKYSEGAMDVSFLREITE